MRRPYEDRIPLFQIKKVHLEHLRPMLPFPDIPTNISNANKDNKPKNKGFFRVFTYILFYFYHKVARIRFPSHKKYATIQA
ncbi:hypothetical protein EB052_01270 [bacterium]|nr:hypothetical protein [bacterium]